MSKLGVYIIIFFAIISCKTKAVDQEEESPSVKTPVSIITISKGTLEEDIELNATSSFLQKWIVRANATGYIQSDKVQLNSYVGRGQSLYSIKTKEAQSIGNSINALDASFRFTGINSIKANGNGFISQINHQKGDYVQDGDQLAVITDTRSFVFLLDVPYELRPYIINKKSLEIVLPDGEKLQGSIYGNMPSMDVVSQTQSIVLRVNLTHPIPENLIAKVKVKKSYRENAIILPKTALLTDETQKIFWVMKLINDSTAVKVLVEKGIETVGKIEILSPVFSSTDKVLVSGNYGLADTANVQVVKE